MTRLLVTANSPGEIAWLRSIASACEGHPDIRLEVLLLPCTFATGREAEVAASFPGVAAVHPVSEYLPLLLHKGGQWGKDVRLVHLGGDLMYSAFLSWRWGWRCWSYLWSRRWWDSAFVGYLARDAASVDWLIRKGTPAKKIEVVGDLVVDSVLAEVPSPPPIDPHLITILPGSREHEIVTGVPFFLGVADTMRKQRPELRFQLGVSPFLLPRGFRGDAADLEGLRALAELVEQVPEPRVGGLQGRLELVDGRLWCCDREGDTRIELLCHEQLPALARSALCLSIPGTKTAEAGTLAVPCLTMLPLNCPEILPFIGPLGLLDWIPGGRYLKGRILLRMRAKVGLLAQPNQRAGRALLPEIIDVLTVDQIAQEALNLLAEPGRLEEVRRVLRELYLPLQGAAEKMVLLR